MRKRIASLSVPFAAAIAMSGCGGGDNNHATSTSDSGVGGNTSAHGDAGTADHSGGSTAHTGTGSSIGGVSAGGRTAGDLDASASDAAAGAASVTCGPDEAVTSIGTCVTCPACNGTGEGLGRETIASAEGGHCICKTKPGYYYNVRSGGIGTYPCDADGDGWVRDSARFSIESKDTTLSINAHCALRQVNAIVLMNVDSESYSIPISPALPLYESQRNDDQAALDGESDQVPKYGPSGRALQATELNSFTKACASAIADHNDNSIADTAEWGRPSLTVPSQADSIVKQGGDGRAPFVDQYTRYSYFVELHMGLYSASASDPLLGRYIIQEKTRMRNQLDPEPIIYGTALESATKAPISDLWQSCLRGRDTWYSTSSPPIGMDFASVSGPADLSDTWHGMMHHSQFKCVDLVDQSAYDQLVAAGQTIASPQKQTYTSIDSGTDTTVGRHLNWQLNSCLATGTPPATAGGNPVEPAISCTAVIDTATASFDVAWAAARFDPPESYRRSCILSCEGAFFYCPGQSDQSGTSCYTMCGNFSATSAVKLTGSGYTLVGEISANGLTWPSSMRLSDTTGYSIEPQMIPGQ